MAVELFISHHPSDEAHLVALTKVLAPLERAGKIKVWHRLLARAGEEVEALAARRFAAARVVVVLLSPDYMASDEHYAEAVQAVERQRTEAARVVPIVVRPCELECTDLAGLAKVPQGARAITTSLHADLAWSEAAAEIGAVVQALDVASQAPQGAATKSAMIPPLVELLTGPEGAARREALLRDLVEQDAGREEGWPELTSKVRGEARREEHERPAWESRRTAALIRRFPSIFAYHCPEAAHHLIPGFDGQDLRALVPEYRARVVTRNEHVRLLGLPPEVLRERDLRGIRLQTLFVPLRFVQKKDRDETRSLAELLEAGRSVVVLGDPGMGKTTLLLFLSLLCAGAAELPGYGGPARVPLFISLRELAHERSKDPNDERLRLIDFLARRAETDLELPRAHWAFFDALLRLGQAVVLLDGLDEVANGAARSRIAQDIRVFQAEYPRCPVWVTSRIFGYTPDVALPDQRFEHVRVGQLEDDQVDDFLGRWYQIQIPDNRREREEHQASLRAAIFRDRGVRRLAGNPLLLTLMAFIHRVLGNLPQDRARLYDRCVDMLLQSWLEARRGTAGQIERHSFEELSIQPEIQKDYLAHLALHIQQKPQADKDREDGRGLLDRDEALECLARRHLAKSQRARPHLDLGAARAEMRCFLDYIGDRAGLLIDRGGGKLAFLHLTFQEYLAAWVFTCAPEEYDNPAFFVAHLGDQAWEQVLLLRLYVVQRMPGGGGDRGFDRILEAIFEALSRSDVPWGWLTLTRALRDNLGLTERDQRRILERAVGCWASEAAFSEPWFTALEEVKLFSGAARDTLLEVLGDAVRGGSPERAVLCLHLEAKLFGLSEASAARVRANPRLPEMRVHLAAFLGEPVLAAIVAEGVPEEAWGAVLAALDGPEVYRLSLGWATGVEAAPAPAALRAAIGWMRHKIGEEKASRRAFAAQHADSNGDRLFREPGMISVRGNFHEVRGPLAALLLSPEAEEDAGESGAPSRVVGQTLAVERFAALSSEQDAAEAALLSRVGSTILAMLAEFPNAEALPESFAGEIATVLLREFGRHFGRNLARFFAHHFGRHIIRDFGRDFVRDFDRHFTRSWDRDFGKRFVLDFGHKFARHFTRDFGRDFIRGLALNWRGRDITGSFKAVLQDDATSTWLIDREIFWENWVWWATPEIDGKPDDRLDVLGGTLQNPLALPLLLVDHWTLAIHHHIFCYGRHYSTSSPDKDALSDDVDGWFLRHPIDVHPVAWAWKEHAAAIQQNLGRLRGPEGALAVLHARYAYLMTGIRLDAEGTRWRELLDEADPDVEQLLAAPATTPTATAHTTSASSSSSSSPMPHPAPAPRPPEPLFTWLHLSDVHFGHRDTTHHWDQKLVLPKLLADLATYRDNPEIALPRIDAIFLTGDIAWSGKPAQYDEARQWLREVAAAAGVDLRRVFAVPGNHDVDRDTDTDRSLKRLVRGLRDGSEPLDEILGDATERAALARRQQAYLDFAAHLAPAALREPEPAPARLWWRWSLDARDGLKVRVIGLNTALLAADDQDRGKLRLGKAQLATTFADPPPTPGELVAVLSHHPFVDGWLADQRDADHEVRSAAHLHLAGHVHEHDSEGCWGGGGIGVVRVVAGAVHGDKLPPDIPAAHGYSFGAVVPAHDGTFRARVYPRRFSDKNRDYRLDVDNVPRGHQSAEHVIPRFRRG